MDTNRLEQFYVLAETKNLRKASQLLGISHTGLHKSMRKLSQDLGQELFFVVGRGLDLTPFARKMLPQIPSIIAQVEALREGEAPKRRYVLGSFEVFTTYALPTLVRQIKNATISLREFGPGKLEAALLSGEVDLGVTYQPVARAGIEFSEVASVRMGLFCRSHTFEKTPLELLPFAAPVLPIHEAPTMVKGLDGWPDHKIMRNVVYSVELMESAMSLVRDGVAVAYLPHFVAKLHNAKVKDEFRFVEMALPARFPNPQKKSYLLKRQVDQENTFERQVAKGLRALAKL